MNFRISSYINADNVTVQNGVITGTTIGVPGAQVAIITDPSGTETLREGIVLRNLIIDARFAGLSLNSERRTLIDNVIVRNVESGNGISLNPNPVSTFSSGDNYATIVQNSVVMDVGGSCFFTATYSGSSSAVVALVFRNNIGLAAAVSGFAMGESPVGSVLLVGNKALNNTSSGIVATASNNTGSFFVNNYVANTAIGPASNYGLTLVPATNYSQATVPKDWTFWQNLNPGI